MNGATLRASIRVKEGSRTLILRAELYAYVGHRTLDQTKDRRKGGFQ